jgi:hypothetical protein
VGASKQDMLTKFRVSRVRTSSPRDIDEIPSQSLTSLASTRRQDVITSITHRSYKELSSFIIFADWITDMSLTAAKVSLSYCASTMITLVAT